MSEEFKVSVEYGARGKPVTGNPGERVAVIRTSDRIQFKRCRRNWNWSSHLKQNLGSKITADPLWLGTGIHYALEDFYGDNAFGNPGRSLAAYAMAYGRKYPDRMPEDWKELLKLGKEMMDYYLIWLTGRDILPTYIMDGVPQLEVSMKIEIPIDRLRNADKIRTMYDRVFYSMTLDRVHEDEYGQLWIVEYKTAKQFATHHFLTDPQVGTYMWGASNIYNKPVAGVIYQQHKKDLPHPPTVLVRGGVSVAQNMNTTHRLYRQTLIDVYGEVKAAPKANIDYLNGLVAAETEHADKFIRRDILHRNKYNAQSEAQKILLETADMLDPDLAMYPNPTRDCAHMCSFLSPCVSMDDGSDWKFELESETMPRPDSYDAWREGLPDPVTFNMDKLLS